MQTFTIYAQRQSTITERTQFEVTAPDEKQAREEAEILLLDKGAAHEWMEMDPTEAKPGEAVIERVQLHAFDPEAVVIEE